MTDFMLALAAAVIGLPVFVVCVVLSFRRTSRYFAIPPLLGLIGGAIAASTANGALAPVASIIVFSIVAVPFAAVCGLVAFIGVVDARWTNGVRNLWGVIFALVAVWLVFRELDRPGSEPTGQFVGTVRNSSSFLRPDGKAEERMDVTLDNGGIVSARAIHDVVTVSGPLPVPHFPDRWEPRRVRVNEYRSLITRTPNYQVIVDSEARGTSR